MGGRETQMHAQPLRAADSVEWNADIYGVFLVFSCTGRRQFDSTSGFAVPKRCPFIRRTQTPRFHPEDSPSYRPRLHFLHSFLLHICKIFLFKKTKKEKYTQAGKQARALSLLPAVSLHARTHSLSHKQASSQTGSQKQSRQC